MKASIDIVENWLEGNHLKIMKIIEKNGELQLNYLNILMQVKEEDMERVLKDDTSYSSSEGEKYKQLMLIYVQLLCAYKKNKALLEFIKRKYAPLNEILSICTSFKNNIAIAYILKSRAEYEKALGTYFRIFNEYFEKLIANQNKEEYIEISLTECKEIYEEILDVCNKNAVVNNKDKKLWFAALEHLYNFWRKVNRIKLSGQRVQNKEFLMQVPKAINEFIKELLYIMVQYLSVEDIMQTITEQLVEMNIETLREIFSSIIISFMHQERILDSAVKLQLNCLIKEIQKKVKFASKGMSIKGVVCSGCKKDVRTKIAKTYYSFTCGHIYHSYCIDSLTICPVCSNNSKGKYILDFITIKQPKTTKNTKQEEELKKPITVARRIEESPPEYINIRLPQENKKRHYFKRLLIYEEFKLKSFPVNCQCKK